MVISMKLTTRQFKTPRAEFTVRCWKGFPFDIKNFKCNVTKVVWVVSLFELNLVLLLSIKRDRSHAENQYSYNISIDTWIYGFLSK